MKVNEKIKFIKYCFNCSFYIIISIIPYINTINYRYTMAIQINKKFFLNYCYENKLLFNVSFNGNKNMQFKNTYSQFIS